MLFGSWTERFFHLPSLFFTEMDPCVSLCFQIRPSRVGSCNTFARGRGSLLESEEVEKFSILESIPLNAHSLSNSIPF